MPVELYVGHVLERAVRGEDTFLVLAAEERHFHLLALQQTERFACLSFRKVANWYCRVLRPGRAIQQQLVMIDSVAHFEALVEQVRAILTVRGDRDLPLDADLPINVPAGPIEHW